MTSISFDVSINDDNLLEGTEDFNLIIIPQTLPGRVTRSSPGQVLVTIIDNDRKLLEILFDISYITILKCILVISS